MLEKWTGNIVGKMHVHKITSKELAEEMGVSRQYVSMILNGTRSPDDARGRVETAVDALIERKKAGGKK